MLFAAAQHPFRFETKMMRGTVTGDEVVNIRTELDEHTRTWYHPGSKSG